ncbi:MAG: cytidine/deoxycytidylate deaminase family protein [Dethiobacter sp.]|nr:cytidine/deoxycytidylate deaminase family protein [Dethiobacter sp.]MBS3898448.1 cytidine/deoxycytidylate deaminase family protein [Dethiobacter sp.]MBS3982702.1 cytidine/deoxycytidylate deaminase family protein [Dethiobacter sp.]MCL4463538.1 cytidine/deoxycytidylate deaminase family protein [Bacillota bacterium]
MRPSWDTYFMEITRVVANRSTCLRRKVGATIIKDKRILTTGYNGAPKGLAHCQETGCIRAERQVPSGERHELCRALHAEQNAILQAALYGVSIQGATVYCTTHPCVMCAKMMINAGMKEVVITKSYPDQLAAELLAEAGLSVRYFSDADNEVTDG